MIEPGGFWPNGIRAVFTERWGGCSRQPFDSFNLGDHVRDDPAHVAANRAELGRRIGARPVFLQQVHGNEVHRLQADSSDGTVADACWTDARGLACTVMVADCLSILLASGSGDSVAAVHAGWRGLAGKEGQGVLESLWASWPAAGSSAGRDALSAWLGPCIGPTAFEVGAEVREAFVSAHPEAASAFRRVAEGLQGEPKYLADLPALARQRLRAAGVTRIHGNDSGTAWCTVSHPDLFFSHRRDAARLGSTGRMAACIWRV